MDNQTIIVKRIKKGGHGHHGGAWKVAFADFVTAMMAFFLLLWLLAAATPKEQAGISSYFIDPIKHAAVSKANSSMIDLGGVKDPSQGQQGQDFREAGGAPSKTVVEDSVETEQARMVSLMTELQDAIETSEALKPFKEQLLLDVTTEGLRIQIVDDQNRPMFDSGSDTLKPYTRDILHELAKVIQKEPNKLSLTGHTDAVPFLDIEREEPYTNWELSADRANASRRELIAGGLTEDKIAKVVGLASIVPFDKDNPRSPVNRRIAIIVLNKSAEAALLTDGIKVNLDEPADQPVSAGEPEIPPLPEAAPVANGKPAPVREPATAQQPPPRPVQRATRSAPAVDLAPEDNSGAPVDDVIPLIDPIKLPVIPNS